MPPKSGFSSIGPSKWNPVAEGGLEDEMGPVESAFLQLDDFIPSPGSLLRKLGPLAAGSIGFGKLKYPAGSRGTQEIVGDYLRRAYKEWSERLPDRDKGFESWLGDNPLSYHGRILQDTLTRNPKNPVEAVKTNGWFTVGGTPATDLERAAMARQGMAANPSIQERQLDPSKMAELQEWIKQQLGY